MNASDCEMDHEVDKIVAHPRYHFPKNDIALLRLKVCVG